MQFTIIIIFILVRLELFLFNDYSNNNILNNSRTCVLVCCSVFKCQIFVLLFLCSTVSLREEVLIRMVADDFTSSSNSINAGVPRGSELRQKHVKIISFLDLYLERQKRFDLRITLLRF